MEHKTLKVTVKQVGVESDRTLRFIGSDETSDRDNDIIDVAGWNLDNYMKNPVALWSHDGSTIPPIGKTVKLNKDLANKSLVFDIKFPTLAELSTNVESPSEHAKFVDTVYNMCKNGYLNAVSVGFNGIKYKTRDDPAVLELPEWQRGHEYIEQELYEISVCSIPSNPNALQAAKSKGLIDEKTIRSFFYAQKGAIPFKAFSIADEGTAWDGPKETAAADTDDLKVMCAWYDSDNSDIKSSYKLPHHEQDGYKTVWEGVAAAMAALLGARGGVDIPDADKKAVYNHLAKHYKQFDKDVPDYKTLSESEVKSMLEKSGAKLSEDSKKALSDIQTKLSDGMKVHKSAHKSAMDTYKAVADGLDGDGKENLAKAIDTHEAAHKEAAKCYKECADSLKKFINPGEPDGVTGNNGGTSDGVECAIEALSLEVKALTDLVKGKHTTSPNKNDEIDLDSITSESLTKMVGKIFVKEFKALTGKI